MMASRIPRLLAVLWMSAAGGVCAQEGNSVFGPQGATPKNVPPTALPAPPPGIARAMTTPTPGDPTSTETPGLDGPLPPDPVMPQAPIGPDMKNDDGKIKLPNIRVSEIQKNGYIEEQPIPQRLPILPEDPDSAWWESNPRLAFDQAKKLQRPMLLLFTSITDTKCMALSEEVFATRTFNEYVKENLVICYLNYPRNPSNAPDSMRRVKEQFNVRGFPNILIFNPEGDVVREVTGYRSGKPVDYFGSLKAILAPEILRVEGRKDQLRQRGFRDWEGENGRQVFAKFVRRDDMLLTLQGADGEYWTTKVGGLSANDQAYAETFPKIDEIIGRE